MKRRVVFGSLVVLATLFIGIMIGVRIGGGETNSKLEEPNGGWEQADRVSGAYLRGDLTEVKLLDGAKQQVEYAYNVGKPGSIECDIKFYDYSETKRSFMLNMFGITDHNGDGLIDEVSYFRLPHDYFQGEEYVRLTDDKGDYIYIRYVIKRKDASSWSARVAEIFAEAENIYNQLPIKAELR